jgi:hypothetical protein
MATILGTPGNDFITGTEENDLISSLDGDDVVSGADGSDAINGGAGEDTAVFGGIRSGYTALANPADGNTVVAQIPGLGGEGLDTLSNVEKLAFFDSTVDAANVDTGLEYVASYTDLLSVFGTDAQAGVNHFVAAGYTEEGRTVTFDALQYIASYDDLINAFGAESDAGASHYVAAGFAEGRSSTFNGLQYIASYGDLITVYGLNPEAGASHFIANGFAEGRVRDDFNETQYLAGSASSAVSPCRWSWTFHRLGKVRRRIRATTIFFPTSASRWRKPSATRTSWSRNVPRC